MPYISVEYQIPSSNETKILSLETSAVKLPNEQISPMISKQRQDPNYDGDCPQI